MPAVLSGRAVNGPVFSDLLGLKEVPELKVEKFGSCNVPMYVFDPCDRQEESQREKGVEIVHSFPASGGEYRMPTARFKHGRGND